MKEAYIFSCTLIDKKYNILYNIIIALLYNNKET